MAGIADIVAAAKTTIERIEASAKAALDYIDLWNIAGGNANPVGRFFKFINSWLSDNPAATRKEAAEEYRTAGYWSQQGKYLDMLDPDIPIPRVLGSVISRDAEHWITGQNYRYMVDVRITWAGSGYDRTFGVYVHSDIPLTQSGAMAQAVALLVDTFDEKSKPVSEGGHGEDWYLTSKVTGFAQYKLE